MPARVIDVLELIEIDKTQRAASAVLCTRFNLGIELGQLAILAAASVALSGVDLLLGHRLRVVTVSAAVAVAAVPMALERLPW